MNLLRTPPERMTPQQRKMMDDAGLFWDGLGSWVKNLPQLTLRVPGPF